MFDLQYPCDYKYKEDQVSAFPAFFHMLEIEACFLAYEDDGVKDNVLRSDKRQDFEVSDPVCTAHDRGESSAAVL